MAFNAVLLLAGGVLLLLLAVCLPPGPPTCSLIGNLHQIPRTGAHYRFTEWSKTYGGIFSLKLGPVTAVVITDRRLVKQLLDKKGNLYSDRPNVYVWSELITGGDHLLMMKHGEKWRLLRRLIHSHFNEARVAREHVRLVEAEAAQMLHDVLMAPGDLMMHPKRSSNSIINSLVYGIRTPSVCTPHMVQLYTITEEWLQVMEMGARPLVDMFPFIKWVPEVLLGGWKTRSRSLHKLTVALHGDMMKRVRKRRETGRHTCFLDAVLNSIESASFTLSDNELMLLAGVLIEGGSDTSAAFLLAFLQAMATHPHVQRRAHVEIDALLGCSSARSPRWDDYDGLPYVTQIVKETMRWLSAMSLGISRATTADDMVDGYNIPKGTIVILNVWGLHHPPHDATAFVFDPERFVNQTAPAATYAASGDYATRDHYSYGAGRRLCPGIHLAERNLFIGVAKLLWAFDFEADGEIDTDSRTGYSQGILHCAKPFSCKVRVRSKDVRDVVLSEWVKAKAVVAEFDT
ncbi:uncharacterized protein K452DRAFT_359514 [Aplosporella prunicola CBS 121167]|uniref:Cytochrome P450 n=1 Tax=Aplosporella prunicola CBS 121167 TaxID=1176127 RepID=A0A6A6BAV6_9PEZI|nr:uncharacterized protein K452DRAFT_359514 [Aplosporella prunicola CBS 121167]KAF2141156.1 hypothetical protein K452DRAFT_359514 [Aplosporella prunicola CBS 121167]